jgi:protein gp37
MSAKTSIEWTDRSWNPARGCSLVSDGCKNCYAMKFAHRFSGAGKPYEGLTVLGKHGPRWTGRARFVPEMLHEPLTWARPARVFVNSMSDLFHEDLSDTEIAAVFGVMAAARQHTFQVLTKRPDRMREWFKWASPRAAEICHDHSTDALERAGHGALSEVRLRASFVGTWPLRNVWLGASVEHQAAADERIPHLLATPAAVRFLSCEPLLGALDLAGRVGQSARCPDCGPLDRVDEDGCCLMCGADAMVYGVDWVIVGGESGPGARPMALEWARSIIAQCRAADVPVFVKQMGANPVEIERVDVLNGHGGVAYVRPVGHPEVAEGEKLGRTIRPHSLAPHIRDRKGGDMAEWPEDLRVREFPAPRH